MRTCAAHGCDQPLKREYARYQAGHRIPTRYCSQACAYRSRGHLLLQAECAQLAGKEKR